MSNKQLFQYGLITLGCIGMVIGTNTLLQQRTPLTGAILGDVPVLGACTGLKEDEYFFEYANITADNDVIDTWSQQYHDRIEAMVTQQLDDANFTPQCDADTFADFLQPTSAMSEAIAAFDYLQNDPDSQQFSRLDIGIVALEVLRSYECALQERSYVLLMNLVDEVGYESFLSMTNLTTPQCSDLLDNDNNGKIDYPVDPGCASSADPVEGTYLVDIGKVNEEHIDQYQKIRNELDIARPALERSLRIINGRERTKVLQAEIECLQRASIDLRNASGLAAEANSCLPRIWNSRDALRDFNER